jgi:hypothetical protein
MKSLYILERVEAVMRLLAILSVGALIVVVTFNLPRLFPSVFG